MNQDTPTAPHEDGQPLDRLGALRVPEFRYFWIGSFLSVLGMQMQTVAVGWDIYERTHSSIALGWVGFVEMLPVLVLALVAGHVADRVDRRLIVMSSMGLIALSSIGLAISSTYFQSTLPLYGWLLVGAMGRAFQQPAKAALVPQIVPLEHFAGAVTLNLAGFQLASVTGPLLGGLLLLVSPAAVYLTVAVTALSFVGLLMLVRHRAPERTTDESTLEGLGAGITFVWSNKVLLGAMTLDMLAVLFGGAVALLPVYAKDILSVGKIGFGLLQAAPAIGALCMGAVLIYGMPMTRAGHKLLWSVAGFGVVTIVFGLSRSFVLSLMMLFLTGAFDSISVVIRHTLVQLLTPDEMRGRVSAINGIFIGASNKLGGFESGLVAQLFASPTFSVVSGGVATLLIVGVTAVLFPPLRRYGSLLRMPLDRSAAQGEPPPVSAEVISPAEAELELGGTPFGSAP